MKKYKFETKTVKEKVVKKLICNACGSKQDPYEGNCTEININFGYGSRYDGDRWEIELCDNCLDKFKNELKIKPWIRNMF